MKKFSYFLIIIFFVFLFFVFFLRGNNIVQFIIELINKNNENYPLIVTINFIYFLIALPVTPIILANGFFLGNLGFLIIYSIIIIESIIIFYFSKFIYKYNKKNNFFQKKVLNNKTIIQLLWCPSWMNDYHIYNQIPPHHQICTNMLKEDLPLE